MVFSILIIYMQILSFLFRIKGILALSFVLLSSDPDFLVVVFKIQIDFSFYFAHVFMGEEGVVDV